MKKGEIIIYETAKKQAAIEVRLEKETIWLTQVQIASLFGTQRPAITKHLNHIFQTGELQQKAVSSILEHTAADGKISTKPLAAKNCTRQLKINPPIFCISPSKTILFPTATNVSDRFSLFTFSTETNIFIGKAVNEKSMTMLLPPLRFLWPKATQKKKTS